MLEETPSGAGVSPHWHYYLEMLYILKGDLQAQCDNDFYMLHPGDLILFYPQAVHSMHRAPESKEDVEYFVIMIDLNFLNITNEYRTRFSKLFRIAYQQNPDYTHFRRTELQELPILQLLSHSLEEKRTHSYGYDVLICSNIASLLTYLMRCLQKKGVDTDTIITAPDDCDASIYSISKYIEQHCGEPLRVHELAQMCGMSYSYFAKKFLAVYGKTCKEYIEEMRIIKAEEFLVFTDFDLQKISSETGFSDCSHMIKSFKKLRGITPKKYRIKLAE